MRQRAEVEKREAAALLARSDAEKRRVQEKYQKARTTLREITAEFQNVRAGQLYLFQSPWSPRCARQQQTQLLTVNMAGWSGRWAT